MNIGGPAPAQAAPQAPQAASMNDNNNHMINRQPPQENNALVLDDSFSTLPTLEQVRRASKEDLLKQYSCGCTPLRHAIKHGASLEVVQLLLDKAPEAMDRTNSHGNVVLSHVKNTTVPEVALLIAQLTSDRSLLQLDLDGDYPLHCLLQNKASEAVLQTAIRRCPTHIFSHQNNIRRATIHEAVIHGASLSVIQKIAERAPDALGESDADGKLPFHWMGHWTDLAVVQYLLYKSPPFTFFTPDKEGRLPLHTAIQAVAPVPVIQYMVEWSEERKMELQSALKSSSNSSSNNNNNNTLPIQHHYTDTDTCNPITSAWLAKADRHGRLPLHMALDYSASDMGWKNNVLKIFIRQSPESVWEAADHKGRLPLHCLRFVSRMESVVLKDIVQKSGPAALLQQDHRGRTPLHVALEDPHVRVSAIQFLLGTDTQYPVLDIPTSEGHLPIHTAALYQTNTDIIRFLIEEAGIGQAHAMRLHKDNQGCLPVHLAVQRRHGRPPARLVNILLGDENDESPLLTQDEVGQLPLHCAICFRTSTDILKLLVRRTPLKGFAMADFRYRIPLRCAIEGSTPAFIFQLILDKTPAKVFDTPENAGNLMLHYLPSSVSVDAVDLLSARYPQLLTTKDSSGRLPIHRAIVRLASTRVLENMISHAPETLRVADDEGRLPLHLLPDSGQGLDHVQLLIERSGKQALVTADNYGQLPLHRAVSEEMRLDIIRALVDACPQALVEFDQDGRLPLHHALLPSTERASWRAKRRRGVGAGSDPSLSRWAQWQKDLVLLLMSECPQTLYMKDHLGRLPLHRAVVHISSIPACILQTLIEMHPGSIKVADDDGKLPLHYALQYWNGGVSLPPQYGPSDYHPSNALFVEGLKILLKAFSGAVYMKDKKGKIPLDYAMLSRAPVDAYFILNRLAPDLLAGSRIATQLLQDKMEE